MGPRLVSRGNVHRPVDESAMLRQLQWGRGLLAAEMRRRIHRVEHAERQLQWGRGLLAAEMSSWTASRRCEPIQLQWGRGLLAAEITSSVIA